MPLFELSPASRKKSIKKKAVGIPAPRTEESVFTVSFFLDRINEVLSKEEVFVKGEISGFQMHPTGVYFGLKDKEDGCVMNCYMNPYAYRKAGVVLDEGLEVKVGGWSEIYKAKGRFSFKIQTVELSGEGTLRKAYELLKKKLEEEGLFSRKRELPQFIRRVGVVTSRTGAVIDDFRKNLEPFGISVKLFDARVEGAQAVPQILRAIRWFNGNMSEFDVLVIIRGGGSLEDLQAFNNELVAREIFASKIPTICGIGHDRDVPIASLVADRETSTPSMAAMLVNSSWNKLREDVPLLERKLLFSFERALSKRTSFVRNAAASLSGGLARIFTAYRTCAAKISDSFAGVLHSAIERTEAAGRYISAVSPERNLKLGYSIILNDKGRVVRRAADVSPGQRLRTRLSEGSFVSKVEEVDKKENQ